MLNKIKTTKKAILIEPKVTPLSIKEKPKHKAGIEKGKTNVIERYYGKTVHDKKRTKSKINCLQRKLK